MNNKIADPIAIIGAGISGLTAANYLHSQNIPFILYEGSDKVAGLAASYKDEDGFSHDFGAHFTTNRLAETIGFHDTCKVVKHYGECVWLNQKIYGYPFGLIGVGRMFKDGVLSQLSSKTKTPESVAELFRQKYGKSLANEVAIPLIEAWSGAKGEELSPDQGGSLPSSILKTLYLKLASKIKGRAVALGYSRELPEKASVYHVYPEDGISTLCKKLSEGIEDKIQLNSPVEAIIVEDEKVTSVKVKGETKKVSAVISTVPVHILGRLVQGTDKLQHLTKFRYRPMLFLNIKLEGRSLLPDTVLWFPESQYPFFRLTEAPISMPWLAPSGKTIITVDIGCQKGDEFWTMDQDKLTSLCLKYIKEVIPDVDERFIGSSILKTTISYPIYLNEYEQERQQFHKSTGIDNLASTGRNGEFMHIFMEDVYIRTRRKVNQLVQRL